MTEGIFFFSFTFNSLIICLFLIPLNCSFLFIICIYFRLYFHIFYHFFFKFDGFIFTLYDFVCTYFSSFTFKLILTVFKYMVNIILFCSTPFLMFAFQYILVSFTFVHFKIYFCKGLRFIFIFFFFYNNI